jgi:hypothetical protein
LEKLATCTVKPICGKLKMENYMVNHEKKNLFSIVGYNAAEIYFNF